MMNRHKFTSRWLLAVVGLVVAGALYIGIGPDVTSAHDPLPENCHTYQATKTLNHAHNQGHDYHCEGLGHPNYETVLTPVPAPDPYPIPAPVRDTQMTSFEHVIRPVEKCLNITVGAEMFATVVSMATLMGVTVAEDFAEGEHADVTTVRVCYEYAGFIVGRVWAEVR